MESKSKGPDWDCVGSTWVKLPHEERVPLRGLYLGLSGLYPGPILTTWVLDYSALPGGPLNLGMIGKSVSVFWPSAHRRLKVWHKDDVSPSPRG